MCVLARASMQVAAQYERQFAKGELHGDPYLRVVSGSAQLVLDFTAYAAAALLKLSEIKAATADTVNAASGTILQVQHGFIAPAPV
jgi:hypothetical protein